MWYQLHTRNPDWTVVENMSEHQGLNCNFLYMGTLEAFDNGVKLIVMHRCIVNLKYGTETRKFLFTYGRQPAAAVATHR